MAVGKKSLRIPGFPSLGPRCVTSVLLGPKPEGVCAYKKLKSMNGEFSIIHVSSEVMEVFKLTGFDQNFDIQTK